MSEISGIGFAFKSPVGDMSVVCRVCSFTVLIPCHRVIRSDKKIGGLGVGTKLKQVLINAEA